MAKVMKKNEIYYDFFDLRQKRGLFAQTVDYF